ncbi:ribosomal large subunit pseudouridine synthase F [Hymenobacter daecheongensis DSM 21074]|uniref:Pseudouridine synthase n=1 Tax=Hymenobacter daecheongensis DSM 21074 TaxID=1121955 RepID=A0A1M6KG58_9BACT|nr:23S rRNA pseudouridine(2604) synthase RluF [Hymenobacter daecheongensis]SHJ57966.1 ribosomal large subunit pseudouridine synthase F [Hymenobacter daecheongensis DSM 21074]
MPSSESTRLNKYISESGVCSRREADKFIAEGNVFVNGKRASIGDQVTAKDKVIVNGQRIEPRAPEDAIYIAFNKPPGITSTTETSVKGNIVRYIKHSERIFPIGRLDKDSQGLILLTSDGDIVNKILRAGNRHEKEYIVMVDKPIKDEFLEGMRNGVSIMGIMTQKCDVQKETNYIFRITLIQGMNRQIRKMCEAFGYEVVQLERIRVMNITLKGLGVGDWRELTEKELAGIMEMTKNSSGTKEASLPKRRAPVVKQLGWDVKGPRTAEEGAFEQPARAPRAPKAAGSARPATRKVAPGKPAAGKAKARPKAKTIADPDFFDGKPLKPTKKAAAKAARPSIAGGKFKPAAKTLNRAPKGNAGRRGGSR